MSFDRIAPFYRALELLLAGGKLQRCRVMWLDRVWSARNILLVGEGHGRFLEVCARRFPRSQILYVDASGAMLRIAKRRWLRAGGRPSAVEFVRAELPSWTPPANQFDLVVTHYFLDCFTPQDLELVVERLARAAKPTADWLVADFAVPPCGWRRLRAQAILALAYGCFQPATGLEARAITPPDGMLQAAGFQLQRRQTKECGLLQADWWARRCVT